MAHEHLHRQELVVEDSEQTCPYLPEETARMPLRLPLTRVSPARLDEALSRGDRRSGMFLYRPQCPECRACQSIRLNVDRFTMSKSQKRVARKASRSLSVSVQRPIVDGERVRLYNAHRTERNLAVHDGEIDVESYEQFLVDSCCDTVEISYRLDEQLIGVGVTDCGSMAMSAVYFYFDPGYSQFSPGVYNVLRQVELCREWGKRYLYLGYFIAACRHMSYKAKYLPHERLIDGEWRPFAKIEI